MPGQIEKLWSPPRLVRRKRVAAYARVSSGKDAMLHSLAEQVSYYSDLIQRRPDWLFAGIFADEAITGTKEARPEFQRMLTDCRNGLVDMVITKSISRFARNTVTLLEAVRMLKDLGVDVYFEEQRIHTISAEGELLLTILASYAQEESRSDSENAKWRIRRAYQQGEIMCWRMLFGYRIKKGSVEIDPEKGPIAQQIFTRFAAGESMSSICRWLNQTGHFGALGGKWQTNSIRQILSNEKYLGDAILQKTFINNHLEKKRVTNTGELPRYYVYGTHPALIDKATFERVQQRLADIAARNSRPPRQTNEFTGMIRCPNCGRNYRRTLMNGSAGWICPTYYSQGKAACQSKKIPEETLRSVIADVLSLDNWDPDAFTRQVAFIIAVGPNTLELHMADGSIHIVPWKDRSRRESWTPEMREKARQDYLRRKHE